MESYCYKCFDCKTKLPIEVIEPLFQYLCPKCSKVEPDQPLKGVLLIEYDYSGLKKQLNKQDFMKMPAGQFWQYPQLLPLKYHKQGGQICF